MRSETPPGSNEQVAGEGGPELSQGIRELLAAERTPPDLPGPLEERLWARLEGELGLAPTSAAAGPSASMGVGVVGKSWLLGGAFIAVAGLVIAVYFAVAGGERANEGVMAGSGAPKEAGAPGYAVVGNAEKESVAAGDGSYPVVGNAEKGAGAGAGGGAAVGDRSYPVVGNAEGGAGAGAGGGVAVGHGSYPVVGNAEMEGAATRDEVSEGQALPAARPRKETAGTRDPIAERALLTKARAALRDGAQGEAFAALAEHKRLFLLGELAEEREALHVHALVAAGRLDEARRARARFVARFPNSIHSPGLSSLSL